MDKHKPSLTLAIIMYGGSVWLSSHFWGEAGWFWGGLGAFVLRGTLNEPIFRDGTPTGITDTAEKRVEARISSGLEKLLRNLLGGASQIVGTAFVAAIVISVVLQLPTACAPSNDDGSFESEFRSR
jgi:hypothetical protein